MAEMTGTTLYTVSRLLSDWERKGHIKTGREKIQDPQAARSGAHRRRNEK
ncbi:MAG: helix-turn-helix domain-containing protein [Anaerolineales bacterium]|nr:helix-turn-helix domain-containing protein [Anaerolineales bacterium]